MNKNLVTGMLIAFSISSTGTMLQARNPEQHQTQQQPKHSASHKFGFFLIHCASLVGGVFMAKEGYQATNDSIAIRKLGKYELIAFKLAKSVEWKLKDYPDGLAEKYIDYCNDPASTATFIGVTAGGVAAALYGAQGLIKDFIGLFD